MYLSHEAKTAPRNASGEILPLGQQRVPSVYITPMPSTTCPHKGLLHMHADTVIAEKSVLCC